jgi:PilZ domain
MIPGFGAVVHSTLKLFVQNNGMHERRAQPRKRVFKAGTIEFDGVGVDCTIRNISATGAGLEVVSPLTIPHEITLNIRSGEVRQHCYIVWRKEKRIGVAFG